MLLWSVIGCAQEKSMTLEGRVAMKGNAMHPYLTIYDQDTKKSYKIQNKEAFDLIKQQNKILTIEAKIMKDARGPGYPVEIEVLKVN